MRRRPADASDEGIHQLNAERATALAVALRDEASHARAAARATLLMRAAVLERAAVAARAPLWDRLPRR